MDKKQLVALLASYGRSLLAAGIALYAAGVTDPGQLANALWAAILPVVIRYINPNDASFGRLPKVEEVVEAVAEVKVPAKKAAPKKPVAKKETPQPTTAKKATPKKK